MSTATVRQPTMTDLTCSTEPEADDECLLLDPVPVAVAALPLKATPMPEAAKSKRSAGRYTPAEGRVMQAFWFDLDPTRDQEQHLLRCFGARRFAYNWTLAAIKEQQLLYNETGEKTPFPSFFTMSKLFTAEKRIICVNKETGEPWWNQIPAEVFNRGVEDACGAYRRWVQSRKGEIANPKVGFPRFARRGRTPDRFRFACQYDPFRGRRHLWIPRAGKVRLHENSRRAERLWALGRVKVRSITIRRRGSRYRAVLAVDVGRPQTATQPKHPEMTVGVDVGVHWLAIVATPDGEVLERVENPEPLEKALAELRTLQKAKQRRTPGSSRHTAVSKHISRLHAHVAAVRAHHAHQLTTRLARTYGTIHIEDLHIRGLIQQKHRPGARHRRRRLADANLSEIRRQLEYKCSWYGSSLVVVDRWWATTRRCHLCNYVADRADMWDVWWTCKACGADHDKDINAAVSIALYKPTDPEPTVAE